MTVQCPHCSAGYLLPDHLLGPRGARVRCPQCGQGFVVLREAPPSGEPDAADAAQASDAAEGGDLPQAAASLPSTPEPSPPPLPEEPEQVAARLLDGLTDTLGVRLEEARRSGRLLADHGRELMRAWDQYRAALGARADAATFRQALRDRWDVDLGLGPLADPGPRPQGD